MPTYDEELASVRQSIDALDSRIIGLIAERQAQVVRVRERAEEAGASPDVVEATYRAMIAAFIELELVEHRR